jgi:hypothetical protein
VGDVGLGGRWWSLEKNMIDFDINPKEWEGKEQSSQQEGFFWSFLAPPVVKAH